MKFLPQKFRLQNDEELIIREAKKIDAPQLIRYVNRVAGESDFLTFGESEFKKTKEQEEKILEEHHQAKNRIFLVAELNKKIVGILNVNASSKKRMRHIGDFGITVLKAHWGLGIGTCLMQSMIVWAKSNGITRKLNLNVMENNKRAIKLYKKYGFKKEGLLRRDSCIKGKFYDCFIMGLLID